MAKQINLLFIFTASLLTVHILSIPIPKTIRNERIPDSNNKYKLSNNDQSQAPLISFLHRQPYGSQLASIRYYRIVFHCNILPGSLYLRFSNLKPYRSLVQNRQDPSTIFAFRSVGAYSRVQIQSYVSHHWLCMNKQGKIIQKPNVTTNNLACTFRQNSDGPYMTLTSELYPTRQMTYNTLYLLSMNPVLRRNYFEYRENSQFSFQQERCGRFMLDNQINFYSLNRTFDPSHRLKFARLSN